MKKGIIIFCLFLFQTSIAQTIDKIDSTIQDTIEQVNVTERALKPFSARYKFTTKVFSSNKETKFTREVNVFLVYVAEKSATYLLYSTKFGFEDPDFQPFLRKVAYLFDEVVVDIDRNGKIVSIYEKNLDFIRTRWKETKAEVLQTNSGKVVLDYLQTVEDIIDNEDLLFKFLEDDNMFGMLFSGMSHYENQIEKKKKIKGIKTIKIHSNANITNEKYSYQTDKFLKGEKTEKRDGEKMKLEYEIEHIGEVKW